MTAASQTEAHNPDGQDKPGEAGKGGRITLYVICEMGKFGKRVCRVFLRRDPAEAFMQGKSTHLYKFEEYPAPITYTAPSNLFAAHEYDEAYLIHRLSGFYLSHEEAKRHVGIDGLILSLVPED